jgi:hypothetical protein
MPRTGQPDVIVQQSLTINVVVRRLKVSSQKTESLRTSMQEPNTWLQCKGGTTGRLEKRPGVGHKDQRAGELQLEESVRIIQVTLEIH